MTKAPTPDRTPDRIEVVEMDGKRWLQDGLNSKYVNTYILSTPAREAAEELLEACENWVELIERTARENKLFMKLYANSQMDFMQGLEETKASIAKAKG